MLKIELFELFVINAAAHQLQSSYFFLERAVADEAAGFLERASVECFVESVDLDDAHTFSQIRGDS